MLAGFITHSGPAARLPRNLFFLFSVCAILSGLYLFVGNKCTQSRLINCILPHVVIIYKIGEPLLVCGVCGLLDS